VRLTPALFALFLITPLVDISLLLYVGERIGVFETIALVVGTAMLGAALVSRQGSDTMVAIRRELQTGSIPAASLAHGAMILVAGAVLITPGFITDTIGFLLLIPAVRERLRKWGVKRFGTGRTIDL
jgi:UPF0716 protein FxsA